MNLPNKLSLFRVILVPVIAVIYLFLDLGTAISININASTNLSINWAEIIVLILFAVASFTDYLDGMIARKYNMITSFGKFVDPIADKLLVNTMLILFAISHRVPVIAVIIMIWRDMIVDGLRMSASSKGKVVAAGMPGKIKTVLQMFAIIFVMLYNLPFAFIGIPMDQILVWGATIASVYSGIIYFVKLKDVVMETM